ncbi:MAG TPA: hypothetical protein VNQ77_20330 [Frankiaceae bacterium]|nr:hypothetical protein [Frankiaceae bacterium]
MPASACTPAPYQLAVDPERAASGATIRVSGDQLVRPNGAYVSACDGWTGGVPVSPSATATPSPTPSEPSETPLVSLPPLTMPPARVEATATPTPLSPVIGTVPPRAVVELRIQPRTEWNEPALPSRLLARVPADQPVETVWGEDRDEVTEHAFAARVRLPGDLAPGTYEIVAAEKGGIQYGTGVVEVLEVLSATGGSTTAGLLGVAALALVAGAYATVVAGRVGRRAREA